MTAKVPYPDVSSPLRPGRAGIPVPLFNLVYHDAIITPYAPTDLPRLPERRPAAGGRRGAGAD